ncbi:MAG TPA: hypothetical protein VGM64_13270 [Lacunisphaera sp.]|jgi:hypothetical protein
MNWLAIHDKLKIKRFVRGDMRPFSGQLPPRADWTELKAFLERKEAEFFPEVKKAVEHWVVGGTWPGRVSRPAAMFIALRLSSARRTALRLAVPVTLTPMRYLQPPSNIRESEVFHWLLCDSWDALGRLDWLSEIKQTNLAARRHRITE